MILVDENIPRLHGALLGIDGVAVESFCGRSLTNEQLKNNGCKYLFVRSTTRVNRELLHGSKVEFVATATAGSDHIDWDYLKTAGIECVTAEGANANSVAEYVVVAALEYARANNLSFSGLKVGLVGFGFVGKLVANYFKSLGCRVLVNDSPLKEDGYKFPDWVEYGKMLDIFSDCDIVSNHLPLTGRGIHSTAGWFDSDWLGRMRSGALFIHTSRGKILVEEAAKAMIEQRGINFAVDVWEDEPDFDVELAKLCLFATPHIAGYSAEGKIGGAKMVAEKFESYSGMTPDYSEFNLQEAPSKRVISDFEGEGDFLETLLRTLKAARRFDVDTADLLSLTRLSKEMRMQGFDKLRKGYPVRYETLRPTKF